MRVIIAGGRDFNDRKLLKEKCDKILGNTPREELQIVSGGARGADLCGEGYAQDNNIDYVVFNADWKKYGKKAGILRNEQMAKYSNALIAFWDGKSPGTKNMILTAKKLGLKVRIVKY